MGYRADGGPNRLRPPVALERSLILIKPDAVERSLAGEILGRIERRGFTVAGGKVLRVSRELEIKAMEKRLALRDLHCPVCRAEVDSTYLVCPVCTTKLKQACVNCKQPLEALWQICPYCETRVETPAAIDFGDTWETPRAPRRRRAE